MTYTKNQPLHLESSSDGIYIFRGNIYAESFLEWQDDVGWVALSSSTGSQTSGTGGVTVHADLTGLEENDHPQYSLDGHAHTQYSLNTHNHAFSDITATAHDHSFDEITATAHDHSFDDITATAHIHAFSDITATAHDHSFDEITATAHDHAFSDITATAHDHNDIYYTEAESLALFAPGAHTHDDRYYEESEVDTFLSNYVALAGSQMTGGLSGTNIYMSNTVSADNFEGDGSNLTNLADGANGYIQYNSSGELAGSSKFTFDGANVHVGGEIDANVVHSAGNVYAANTLSGQTLYSDFVYCNTFYPKTTGNMSIIPQGTAHCYIRNVYTTQTLSAYDGIDVEGSSTLEDTTINGDLTVTGGLTAEGSSYFDDNVFFNKTVTATHFYGDGSNLTNISHGDLTDLTINDHLQYSLTSHLHDYLSLTGDEEVTGAITATHFYGDGSNLTNITLEDTTINGDLTVTGGLTAEGSSYFDDSVTLDKVLNAEGASTFSATLSAVDLTADEAIFLDKLVIPNKTFNPGSPVLGEIWFITT